MTARLALQGLAKSFGGTEAVRDIDLAIAPGEFVVFVGPSGCGKSTLLRMIAGLEPPTRGTVAVDGRDVTRTDPAKRGMAMVFQSYALYPHMSVAENIAFGLEMAGMAPADRAARVREVARILEIELLLDRRPRQLSGGQRQRVAIGRAIAREPRIFLFDEPLSNLDAELRVRMRLEIARLHARLGATMIYVTHDQVEAMTLADRIVVLRAGRIEQAGSPMELYADPATRFVAGFIGTPQMNLLTARVRALEPGRAIVTVPALGLDALPVPLRARLTAAPGAVTLGLRPENLHPSAAAPFTATLEVQLVERLGGTTHVHCTGPETVTAELRGPSAPEPGTRVTFAVDPADCLLFDAEGARL